MTRITKHLVNLQNRIARAAAAAGRSENDVSILAVSKRHDVDAVHEAYTAGLKAMGENYLQEALAKIPLCEPDIEWHFIGQVQSNKTRPLAENFDWVQTVTSAKVATRLHNQRPDHKGVLNLCIQVCTDDSGHGGVPPNAVPALCQTIEALPKLRLRGLMTLPAPAHNEADKRLPFARLKILYDDLNTAGYRLDTLSMGMTNDLEAAIAEGSTLVRVGTGLFGPRSG